MQRKWVNPEISSIRFNRPSGDNMKLLAAQQVRLGFIGLGNIVRDRVADRSRNGAEAEVSKRGDQTRPNY